MELEKIRNLSDGELKLEESKISEQLFRLRFQLKLGQTDGVRKLRELKREIARFKTVTRERELSIHGAAPKAEPAAAVAAEPKPKKARKAKKEAL
jgi:large subunit ribosomal protein L29